MKILSLFLTGGQPINYFFFSSEKHQIPASVYVLALLYGRAEKYLRSPSSHPSYFSSPDTETTKPFFKKAVPASTKQSMHTNEDNATRADLSMSSRLLCKELLLTLGIIKQH